MPPRDMARVETAKWAQRQLIRMDWGSRHAHLDSIKRTKPELYAMIVKLMSPDEHLEGKATGISVSAKTPIVLKDRPKHRQVTLHRYFRRAV